MKPITRLLTLKAGLATATENDVSIEDTITVNVDDFVKYELTLTDGDGIYELREWITTGEGNEKDTLDMSSYKPSDEDTGVMFNEDNTEATFTETFNVFEELDELELMLDEDITFTQYVLIKDLGGDERYL